MRDEEGGGREHTFTREPNNLGEGITRRVLPPIKLGFAGRAKSKAEFIVDEIEILKSNREMKKVSDDD